MRRRGTLCQSPELWSLHQRLVHVVSVSAGVQTSRVHQLLGQSSATGLSPEWKQVDRSNRSLFLTFCSCSAAWQNVCKCAEPGSVSAALQQPLSSVQVSHSALWEIFNVCVSCRNAWVCIICSRWALLPYQAKTSWVNNSWRRSGSSERRRMFTCWTAAFSPLLSSQNSVSLLTHAGIKLKLRVLTLT